jgi:hypothetical protein
VRQRYKTIDKRIKHRHNRGIGSKHGNSCNSIHLGYILKTSSAKLAIVAASSFDSIGALKSVANSIHAGASALEIINGKAAELRANGVKFGKSIKTCQHRKNFADAMGVFFKDRAAKTWANYVTSFVGAVNDGVPFSFSASKGEAAPKADGAKKSSGKTDNEKMLAALLNVWKLSEVAEDLLIQIEGALADGTPLADAIGEVLTAHNVAVE